MGITKVPGRLATVDARTAALANPLLPAALALQLAVLYLPFLRDLLHTSRSP